jgi:hypothetical protein
MDFATPCRRGWRPPGPSPSATALQALALCSRKRATGRAPSLRAAGGQRRRRRGPNHRHPRTRAGPQARRDVPRPRTRPDTAGDTKRAPTQKHRECSLFSSLFSLTRPLRCLGRVPQVLQARRAPRGGPPAGRLPRGCEPGADKLGGPGSGRPASSPSSCLQGRPTCVTLLFPPPGNRANLPPPLPPTPRHHAQGVHPLVARRFPAVRAHHTPRRPLPCLQPPLCRARPPFPAGSRKLFPCPKALASCLAPSAPAPPKGTERSTSRPARRFATPRSRPRWRAAASAARRSTSTPASRWRVRPPDYLGGRLITSGLGTERVSRRDAGVSLAATQGRWSARGRPGCVCKEPSPLEPNPPGPPAPLARPPARAVGPGRARLVPSPLPPVNTPTLPLPHPSLSPTTPHKPPGVVTEYLNFGQAEGGVGDVAQLDRLMRALSVRPPPPPAPAPHRHRTCTRATAWEHTQSKRAPSRSARAKRRAHAHAASL